MHNDDAYRAGRLLHWALQPRVRPAQEPEYRALVDSYLEHRGFRTLVDELAAGLGLDVLDASAQGLVISPGLDSVFRLRFSEYRTSSSTVDDRLLDGLAVLAIAATVYPRAEDLADDPDRARPAVSADEVEDQLRALCDRLAQAASQEPDPSASDEQERLIEAWRVYHARTSARETTSGQRPRRATMAIIDFALERLREHGCLLRADRDGRTLWQPTRRFNVLARELAAGPLYEHVLSLLEANADGRGGGLGDDNPDDDPTA